MWLNQRPTIHPDPSIHKSGTQIPRFRLRISGFYADDEEQEPERRNTRDSTERWPTLFPRWLALESGIGGDENIFFAQKGEI